MSKPLDLDKIEEELNQISPWPWEPGEAGYENSVQIAHDTLSVMPEDKYVAVLETMVIGICHTKENINFIASAPERIAALVKIAKRVKDLEKALETMVQTFEVWPLEIQPNNKEDSEMAKLASQVINNHFENVLGFARNLLKRGSDEV